jgi:hypothetical protein
MRRSRLGRYEQAEKPARSPASPGLPQAGKHAFGESHLPAPRFSMDKMAWFDTVKITMNSRTSVVALALAIAGFAPLPSVAQDRTAPFTAEEREAVYNQSIEKRASNIVSVLQVTDAAKAQRVHDAIVAQYRVLRARDAAMDVMFISLAKDSPGIQTNRESILPILSETLHVQFIARLSTDLTPQQIETVKNKMTYDKVQVTYDAYCTIIPNLTDSEKTMILAVLKEAREEAMDGGTADEKTAVFQKHKEKINATLAANGHDVAKATKEWEARQQQATANKDSATQ